MAIPTVAPSDLPYVADEVAAAEQGQQVNFGSEITIDN